MEKVSQTQQEQDLIQQLKNQGGDLSNKYGPQFTKYLDKALQHATPPIDKLKSKMDEFSGINGPSSDATTSYNESVTEVRQYFNEVIPHTNELLKVVYDTHTQLREAFMRLDAIVGELKPHFRGNDLYLNEDSGGLLNRLEEQKQIVRDLVNKMLDTIEKTGDEINSLNLQTRQYKPKFLK